MWRLSPGHLTARTIQGDSYTENPNGSVQYDGRVNERMKRQISKVYRHSKGIKKETILSDFSYHVAFPYYCCVIIPWSQAWLESALRKLIPYLSNTMSWFATLSGKTEFLLFHTKALQLMGRTSRMLSTGSSMIMKDMKMHTSSHISWILATPHQKCWGTIWLSLESRNEKPNLEWNEGDNSWK